MSEELKVVLSVDTSYPEGAEIDILEFKLLPSAVKDWAVDDVAMQVSKSVKDWVTVKDGGAIKVWTLTFEPEVIISNSPSPFKSTTFKSLFVCEFEEICISLLKEITELLVVFS